MSKYLLVLVSPEKDSKKLYVTGTKKKDNKLCQKPLSVKKKSLFGESTYRRDAQCLSRNAVHNPDGARNKQIRY